ncbi:MAG: hypothetical protein A2675_03255 [Candidatus Yonathbacteria bacterium RIFCSPHIGHO2_01_FULL_51_10]|uniref:Uncharacterized protein n=1 Tax=Candidatus Yonathbacteria bacterium RIFCSPHIGHO2_01_FULL_51_10 TaxID=1802723 RepID=A0A1G2S8L2_9BACT|nr:MAG: hypothetical protein A2675_03255 [Candidatus Yonathbacteria bacterium RIFCSPHIGHO2_01_FULL_51_10]
MAAKKTSGGIGAGAIMGIAAVAAAAAAGGYFLYGKDGAKNRKKVRGWMLKAKGEILEKVEKLKDVSEEEYAKAIDVVAAKYRAVKSIDPAEVEAMVKELKGHWKNIKKTVAPKATKRPPRKQRRHNHNGA